MDTPASAYVLLILVVLLLGPLVPVFLAYLVLRAAVHPLVSELARVNRNLARMAEQMTAHQAAPPEDEVELEEVHTEEGDRV
jgi:large-conductance mechanosensitive channel